MPINRIPIASMSCFFAADGFLEFMATSNSESELLI